METTKIPKVTTHKHLGITLNSTLSWSDHIKSVYINCARKIGMLKRLKRKLYPSVFKRIYTGAIRPKMEYACARCGVAGLLPSLWTCKERSADAITSNCLHYKNGLTISHLHYFLKYAYTKPQIPCANFASSFILFGSLFSKNLLPCSKCELSAIQEGRNWRANFLARNSAKLFVNTKVHIFGKETCKTHRQF